MHICNTHMTSYFHIYSFYYVYCWIKSLQTFNNTSKSVILKVILVFDNIYASYLSLHFARILTELPYFGRSFLVQFVPVSILGNPGGTDSLSGNSSWINTGATMVALCGGAKVSVGFVM